MVSHYRLVSGLGTLYALPLEIRHRIYQMYFSHRVVVESKGDYHPRYPRELLCTSKAVYNEAAPREKTCGVILLLDGVPMWLPPPRIRDAVHEVDFKNVEAVLGPSGMSFIWNDFPVLKVVRDGSWFIMIAMSDVRSNATVDDAFKGRVDDSVISDIQESKSYYQEERGFDWDELPASVQLVLHYEVYFDSLDSDSKRRTIVSFTKSYISSTNDTRPWKSRSKTSSGKFSSESVRKEYSRLRPTSMDERSILERTRPTVLHFRIESVDCSLMLGEESRESGIDVCD